MVRSTYPNVKRHFPTIITTISLVSPPKMGNIFSHSDQPDPSNSSSSATLKRQPSDSAGAAGLKQSIAQNMRLSKSKVTSLLKANHMNYSIVHRNHFYNTLPHVSLSPVPVSPLLTWCSILERRIFLGQRHSGYLMFLRGSVKLWNRGWIHPMKLHG
jgi:hypothetical protein